MVTKMAPTYATLTLAYLKENRHRRWHPLFKLPVTKKNDSNRLMITFDITKTDINIPHELGK